MDMKLCIRKVGSSLASEATIALGLQGFGMKVFPSSLLVLLTDPCVDHLLSALISGAMTSGYASDATERAVMADIVAARYT